MQPLTFGPSAEPSRIPRHARDLVRRIAVDHQAAMLVVTHDETIFDRFDRLASLRDGRIEGEMVPSAATAGA